MTCVSRLATALAVLAVLAVAAVAAPAAESGTLSPAEYLETKLLFEARVEADDFETAVALAETLVTANPADGELKLRLAWGLLELGRPDEARPLLVECLESGFGNEATLAMVLARGCARRGEVPRALALIERALAARTEDRPDLQTDEYFAGRIDTHGEPT